MKNSKKIYKKINTVLEKIILCAFIISIVSFVGFFVSTIGFVLFFLFGQYYLLAKSTIVFGIIILAMLLLICVCNLFIDIIEYSN